MKMFQCINWATTQYLICHYYKTILNVETLIILPNKVLCIFMQNSFSEWLSISFLCWYILV